MHRRTFLTATSAATLTACASGGPRLTTQTVDLKRIAVFPIKEYPATAEAGPFNTALIAPAPASKASPPPITPALLGMAIGNAMRASSDATAAASRYAIGRALVPVGLDPRNVLSEALNAKLTQRAVPVEPFSEPKASEAARTDWDFSQLPPGFDAILDVQLVYAGYFFDKENKGFSPQVYVTAQLLHTAGRGTRLESFQYESDSRSAEGYARFFTTPKSLTVPSLEQIANQAQPIREGMTAILLAIAEKLADDVDRAVKKLPQLK